MGRDGYRGEETYCNRRRQHGQELNKELTTPLAQSVMRSELQAQLGKKFRCLLRNLKVHCHVHNSLALVPILR